MEFSKQGDLTSATGNIQRQDRLQEWFEPAAQWHRQGQRSFLSLTLSTEYQLHPQTSFPLGMAASYIGYSRFHIHFHWGESREVYPGIPNSTKIHPAWLEAEANSCTQFGGWENRLLPFSELNKHPTTTTTTHWGCREDQFLPWS